MRFLIKQDTYIETDHIESLSKSVNRCYATMVSGKQYIINVTLYQSLLEIMRAKDPMATTHW